MSKVTHTPGPEIPEGFVEVTRERFFSLLSKAAAIDPMPYHGAPDYTTWDAQRGPRITWGWSTPGWRDRGPCRYAVRAALTKAREPSNG